MDNPSTCVFDVTVNRWLSGENVKKKINEFVVMATRFIITNTMILCV